MSLAPIFPVDDGPFAPRLDELDCRDDSDNSEPADLTEIFDVVFQLGTGLPLDGHLRRSGLALGCKDPSSPGSPPANAPLMCKSPEGVNSKLPAVRKSPPEEVLCNGIERADDFFRATGFVPVLLRLPIAGQGAGDRPAKFCTGDPGIASIVPEI